MFPTAAGPVAAMEWAGRGPTLLLVHGAGGNAAAWVPMMLALPGRHAIAIDLPGHGRSARLDTWSWQVGDAVLDAVIKALSPRPVVIVGHSLGGMLAVRRAARQPALAAAVTVDGWIGAPLPWLWDAPAAAGVLEELAATHAAVSGPPDRARTLLLNEMTASGVAPPDARPLVERALHADAEGSTSMRPSADEVRALYGGIEAADLWSPLRSRRCAVAAVLASRPDPPPWATADDAARLVAARRLLVDQLRTELGDDAVTVLPVGHDMPLLAPTALADAVSAVLPTP